MSKYLPCRKCGSVGFYKIVRINGSGKIHVDQDGLEIDAAQLHDDLKYVNGKRAYCEECHAVAQISPNYEASHD